jgi:hypothetical protein
MMQPIWIVVSAISVFEYLLLTLYILLGIKYRKARGISTTKIQKIFISLVLLLVSTRILSKYTLFITVQLVYDLILALGYLALFNIYFLISYTW